ncbi:acyl-coa n-acyltransferase [Lucifera butyrica]|uniref:Acyl-coa n-acyltransferase n=1 Tax=Lucifera butyrica TaxID=1351585 RepID=A0A498RG00_9FIRM|nr:GNAT family N-acetyltransferase [Lucifera butyrica]VBB09887.1 acyl-coa n-acyltransferase [Lucifera butyrica]
MLIPTIWHRDGFMISTDKRLLDETVIHRFLSEESYWAKGIKPETVHKSIENSVFCFGVYTGNFTGGERGRQVGFARMISDLTRVAYLADVFILPPFRGRGLGKWLVETIMQHPAFSEVGRFLLVTRDAQELYAQYGFRPLDKPEEFMGLVR